MSELKRKILNVVAWVALAVGIVMVIWRIFGDSPTDLAVISPFIVLGLAKIWNVNSELNDFKYDFSHQIRTLSTNTRSPFEKVKGDTGRIENKIDDLLSKRRKK